MVLFSKTATFAAPIACLLLSALVRAAPQGDYQQHARMGSMDQEIDKRQDQNGTDGSNSFTSFAETTTMASLPDDPSTSVAAISPVESSLQTLTASVIGPVEPSPSSSEQPIASVSTYSPAEPSSDPSTAPAEPSSDPPTAPATATSPDSSPEEPTAPATTSPPVGTVAPTGGERR